MSDSDAVPTLSTPTARACDLQELAEFTPEKRVRKKLVHEGHDTACETGTRRACKRLTRGWSGPARNQLVTAGPRWAPAAQPQVVRDGVERTL